MRFLYIFALTFPPFFCSARINFLHIPKTGGTTLHALLEDRFSISEIYPHRRIKGYNSGNDQIGIIEGSEQVKLNAEKMPFFTQELVSGHFPIGF